VIPLNKAVERVLIAQKETRKPLAIIVAGHNGSGKSTMWRGVLSKKLQIPLINADRLMLSILPEPNGFGALESWAQRLRDTDLEWMEVAQKGVEAFVGHAMRVQVPFAMETVFSYWDERPDGTVLSKLDRIRDMQRAGYFVLLLFVGLTNVELSILRVMTRVAEKGHDVPRERLLRRFPKTQKAINAASKIADACVFVDNSRDESLAFTVCRVQLGEDELFDIRDFVDSVPVPISEWLGRVCPRRENP
jgi:predicted ABC-type ATPase